MGGESNEKERQGRSNPASLGSRKALQGHRMYDWGPRFERCHVHLGYPLDRFAAGEKRLQGVLVGLVMQKSRGSADPRKVSQLIAERAGR